MKCHFCGKPLGLKNFAVHETDFCSSLHRSRFESRLKKALYFLRCLSPEAPDLAGPTIEFLPADLPFRPSLRLGITCPLRIPAGWLATVEAASNADIALVAGPVLLDPTHSDDRARQGARAEFGNPATGKLDRIALLGSRLKTLRSQLDRASDIQRQLATA